MKLVLLIALSTFLSGLTGSKLKGLYKVEYDQRFKGFDDFSSIDFSDSTYKKTFKSGNKIHGKLLRSYSANKNEHWVRLTDPPSNAAKGSLDSVLGKSFGVPLIEFLENEQDTIRFRTTYSANLHITINEGKFIRQSR
jgi:hypothetical protein